MWMTVKAITSLLMMLCSQVDVFSSSHFSLIADKITRLLGQGTFGKVVQCYDRQEGRYCAVKIIRAVQKYRDASKIELRVLSTLSRNDPNNTKYDQFSKQTNLTENVSIYKIVLISEIIFALSLNFLG